MHSHSKQSSQAPLSLHAMRGKSWSSFQKHIPNFIEDHETELPPSINNADVQRLDLNDYNLYGILPSDPAAMVLCNQCNHIMAPEGVMRHVKRVHGSKIVPASSSKVRTLLASKGISTAGASLSSSNTGSNNNLNCISNSIANPASTYTIPGKLTNEFSNRLNVNSHDNSSPNECAVGTSATSSTLLSSSSIAAASATGRPTQLAVTNAMAIGNSSSNSNSPISSTKTSTSSSSSKGRSRKQTSKDRDYDPEKHCGVRTGNMKPCTRSLTCKTHSVSLRRNVDGRSKPFNQLLADHRNSTKDTYHKHSSNKQAYSFGDNSNQMLDSIGDSNSSSSFDIERRSLSSNSNQSAIGNYNSDHSTVFFTSSSQPISNLINGSQLMTLSMDTTNINRKPNYTILSPDERSTNISQFSDLSMNSNVASILRNGSNGLINGPVGLNSFNEYSVNDLINDDNGDAFDMTFWENFDNINEADVMVSGFNASATTKSTSTTEHHKTSTLTTAKTSKTPSPSLSFASSTSNSKKSSSNNKRSNTSFNESDRKRKRGNESKDNDNSANRINKELSDEMQKFSDSLFGCDSIKTSKKIVVSGLNMLQKKPAAEVHKTNEQPQSDIICIDDDDDDLALESDTNTIISMDERSISPAVSKFCTNSKPTKISIDLDSPISLSKAPTFKSNQAAFHSKPAEANDKEIPKPTVKLPDPRLKEATAALIEQSIIRMTLSNDHSVHSADLRIITKILSEQDHHHALPTIKYVSSTIETMDTTKTVASKPKQPSEPKQKAHSTLEINSNKSMPKSSSANVDVIKELTDAETDDTTKSKPEPVIITKDGEQQPPKIEISAKVPVSGHGNHHLGTVPMDENENFLLDMMYKCLRGKRVQFSDSNHISPYNNYPQNNHQQQQQQPQHTATNRGVNGNDSTSGREKENNAIETANVVDEENIKATNSLLLPLAQRSMSFKRTMAKPIITNQFAMARGYGVCNVRNAVSSTRAVQQNFFERMQAQQPNGSFSGTMMTIRNGSLIRLNNTNANLSGVNATINQTKPNSPGPQSTNPTTTTATTTATTATTTNQINSAASPSTNSSIVIVNSGATPNATMSGQSYTIFRRPSSAQNIQLITRKTIDQTYAVMPVIHCVRTRTMRPNVTKTLPLQTDQLLASLKTMIRPQKINHQTLATTKKVISVYKAQMQQNAINDMQSRSQKFNHQHHSQTLLPTLLMASPQKQNGHHSHSVSNGTISPRSSHKSGSQKKS